MLKEVVYNWLEINISWQYIRSREALEHKRRIHTLEGMRGVGGEKASTARRAKLNDLLRVQEKRFVDQIYTDFS